MHKISLLDAFIFFFIFYLSVVFPIIYYIDEIRADLISRKVGTALAGLTANFPENQVIDNYYYIDSAVVLIFDIICGG